MADELPPLTLSRKLEDFQLEPEPYLTGLKDIRVLVTGGASGIGLAIATAYAEAGAYVTIVDINAVQAEAHADRMRRCGFHVQSIPANVTSWPSLSAAFLRATTFGPPSLTSLPGLDHVIASAGVMGQPIFPSPRIEVPYPDSVPPEPNLAALDVNARGTIYTVRLAQYYMNLLGPTADRPAPSNTAIPAHYGANASSLDDLSALGDALSAPDVFIQPDKAITLICSTGAYWPVPTADVYNASKGAVRSLFHTLRGWFADRGIRLNMLAPWLIRTPMSAVGLDVLQGAGYPVCEPEMVARAAMHLAADRGIAGRVLQVGLGGCVDMRDDEEGAHGGAVIKELIEKHLGGYRGLDGMNEKILAGFGYRVSRRTSAFDLLPTEEEVRAEEGETGEERTGEVEVRAEETGVEETVDGTIGAKGIGAEETEAEGEEEEEGGVKVPGLEGLSLDGEH